MRVRFAADVLHDSVSWDDLDIFVHYFFDRRHLWDIVDPDEIEHSPWIQTDLGSRAARRNLLALQKCYTESAYPRTNKMHSLMISVTKRSSSDLDLTPTDARRCLGSPARILVENAESDGTFLETMMSAFNRRDLVDAQTEGWFRIEHLGGFGEVEKRIEQIRAITIGPLRVFVFADSDRLHPSHTSATMRKVQDACNAHQVPYAILKKRKIENYLPVNVIQKVHPRNSRTRKAFLCLSQIQKDYYEMKGGFKRDDSGCAIIPEEQETLFQHVPKKILSDLCGGFGAAIWQCFRSYRSDITKEVVKACCSGDPEEIETMLDSIESLL